MKKSIQLIALSLLAVAFGCPGGFRTANAAEADAELNIGPFRLPEGIDKKDVAWRIRAGLDPSQAVEAALAQKRADDLKAKSAKAKK
jgi:hypothetical protein